MKLKLTFEYIVDVKVRVKAYSGTAQVLFDQLFSEVQSENRLELFGDDEWGDILLNIVYKHFHSRNYQYYKLLNFNVTHEYRDNQIHLSGDIDLMSPEELGSGIDISDELVRYLDPILEKRIFDMMTRIVGNLADDNAGIEVTDVIVSDKPVIAKALLRELD